MDDRTRHLITANSHGLPLYLDLAVMRFLDMYRKTRTRPGTDTSSTWTSRRSSLGPSGTCPRACGRSCER